MSNVEFISPEGDGEVGADRLVAVRLVPRSDPEIEEIYQQRRDYAKFSEWSNLDPDAYDEPGEETSNIGIVDASTGKYRSSLRLTRLELDENTRLPLNCISLDMLGDTDSDLRRSAESKLNEKLDSKMTVYDMTRFVVDVNYWGRLDEAGREGIDQDFITMIGGAVAATDEEAFGKDSAVWLFTVESRTHLMLEESGIEHKVLATGKNEEDCEVFFCLVNPGLSLKKVESEAEKGGAAAKTEELIRFGRQAVAKALVPRQLHNL